MSEAFLPMYQTKEYYDSAVPQADKACNKRSFPHRLQNEECQGLP